MKVNLFPLSLLFVGAWMPYGAALAAPGDASQPQAQPVYESSIGGVLPPSSLPPPLQSVVTDGSVSTQSSPPWSSASWPSPS